VIVEEDQLSLAIGKGGQNSRLAVQLTGWGLDIITEDQYQERRVEQEKYKQVFRMIPGISELIALSLTTSGFDSITSITEADLELLQTVPGLENTETASTIRQSATNFFAEHGEIDVNTLTEDLVDNAGPDSKSAATHIEADSDMAMVEIGVEEVLSEAIAEPVGADVEPTTGQDVSVDIDENAETGSDIAGSAVENAEEVISADPEHLNSENSEEEPEQGV
jgi:N utilization substance protein A